MSKCGSHLKAVIILVLCLSDAISQTKPLNSVFHRWLGLPDAEAAGLLHGVSSSFSFSAHLAECVPEKPKRSALNQLTRTLLRKYDCGVRPVYNWTSLTTVYIDLILQSVLEVVRQTLKCLCSVHTLCVFLKKCICPFCFAK